MPITAVFFYKENHLITISMDHSIKVWECISFPYGEEWCLKLNTHHNPLYCKDCKLEQADISINNKNLLIAKGAINPTQVSERQLIETANNDHQKKIKIRCSIL